MTLEAISREAAQSALDRQERSLDELRNRSGILVATASLTITFLGSAAIGTPSAVNGPIEWILVSSAILAFAWIVYSAVSILIPQANGFTFGLSGRDVYESMYRFREDEREVDRRLAYDLSTFWHQNDNRLQPLFRHFKNGARGLAIEVTALMGLIIIRMI